MNKPNTYWVIAASKAKDWHLLAGPGAVDFEDNDPWLAAAAYADLYADDGGEIMQVVVAEHRDGRGAKVYNVRCIVTRECVADRDTEAIVLPPPPEPEAVPEPDTRTLPLFG